MSELRKYAYQLAVLIVMFIIIACYLVLMDRSSLKDVALASSMFNLNKKAGTRHPIQVGFCKSKSDPLQDGLSDDTNITNLTSPSNMTTTWKRPNFRFDRYPLHRRKSTLDCSSGTPYLVMTMTKSTRDIQIVEPGDPCLQFYIRNCCHDNDLRVPNVVHYVWTVDADVGFYTLVSFMSVVRFMRPCLILFHGPYVPKGTLWNYFISKFPHVVLVNETPLTHVFGHELKFMEHGSDVMRIKALKEYGGVYLDWDELLMRPPDPLRNFSFTMDVAQGNQFILADRNATFLHHWLMGYKNYSSDWEYNAFVYPRVLSMQYPELIHVEHFAGLESIHESEQHLGYDNIDWCKYYAFHLHIRRFRLRGKLKMETIRYGNTTIGDICRYILFGRKEHDHR